MKLTTTVIGSYPYARMTPEEAIARAVEDQVEAGVDVISDGQVRADMVGIFVKGIPGYEVDGRKYYVTSKVAAADSPISLDDLLLAKKIAGGRAKVKAIITGPTTIAQCSVMKDGAPYSAPAMEEGAQAMTVDRNLVMDVAGALAAEAKFLTEAGFDVLQLDEPFFSLQGADLDVGMEALGVITENTEFSALHVCGDTSPIMDRLMDAPVDLIEVEGASLDKVDWLGPDILNEKGKKVCWGVVEVSSNDVEEVDELRGRIERGVAKVGAENLWVSPDCGMRVRKPEAAKLKLQRMVEAARTVAASL